MSIIVLCTSHLPQGLLRELPPLEAPEPSVVDSATLARKRHSPAVLRLPPPALACAPTLPPGPVLARGATPRSPPRCHPLGAGRPAVAAGTAPPAPHSACSSASMRSLATARETVLLTVPRLTPSASATSASVMSSK